jgi:hypothetical protein
MHNISQLVSMVLFAVMILFAVNDLRDKKYGQAAWCFLVALAIAYAELSWSPTCPSL